MIIEDYQENYLTGWCKIYRSISNKSWYHKSEYVHLWLHLIVKATHQKRDIFWNGRTVALLPGPFVTGWKKLSSETGINENKVERILKVFENEQQIEQQKTNTSRCITIINYNQYQNSEQLIEQQVNNKRTTGEQRANNGRTTTEQRVNTKQEYKELKNDKNVKNDKEIILPFDSEIFAKAWQGWKDYKQAQHNFRFKGADTEQIALKHLAEKSGNNEKTALQIIEQSIANGWKGFFELKKNKANGESFDSIMRAVEERYGKQKPA